MDVLVDTTYLYALMVSRGLFSATERRFLQGRDARVHVSAVSIWEMRLKYASRYRSGERKSAFDPSGVLEALEEQNVAFLQLTMDHAVQTLNVPLQHKDPFDELLLVQAQVEGLGFLTRDRLLVDHPLAITVP